jgi:hypothetical protein
MRCSRLWALLLGLAVAAAPVAGQTGASELKEQYGAREKAAKSAQDLYELGLWAQASGRADLAKRAFERALARDRHHAPAHAALGHVLHKGSWISAAERDRQVAIEMRAKGLVSFQGQWVTPEDAAKLEAGLEQVDGEWLPLAEARARRGLAQFEGAWYPAHEARARALAAEVSKLAGVPLTCAAQNDLFLAGTFDARWLEQVAQDLRRARAWFDPAFGAAPLTELWGGSAAQFYLWPRSAEPYLATLDFFAAQTRFLPPQWSSYAAQSQGFFWVDPYPLSSARLDFRPETDLAGHCAHHLGHLMVNRLDYDGRLLPPWYDEALAALTEFKVFGRNAVFCRANLLPAEDGRSKAGPEKLASFAFDARTFREGGWRPLVRAALEAGAIPAFDRMAARQLHELELLDIAAGMAILEWLEAQSPGAPGRFHGILRETQPAAPQRVVAEQGPRQAAYDRAFSAAVELDARAADKSWRSWLLAR